MIFKSIKKVHEGAFVHRYDISYETKDGRKKIYEMISRNPRIKTLEDLQKKEANSVVLILHDESGEKLLLNREFRLSMGDWIYSFPAGLIEPGETPEETARRELKEETGLDLVDIKEILPLCYSAVGFSNETNLCAVGTAAGTFQESSSAVEEIEAGWYTKEDVRRLLQSSLFTARTQIYSYLWSK